ncbi:MAG TPA: helix-turn-helix domain-containing protein [Anaerolineae bacterium]|nr:helix-turn-helix domain-containing protein [Anaerolineae bacterium]
MDMLTVKQAAKELSIAETTLRFYCQEGRIGTKVGRQWVITRKELERFQSKPRPVGRPPSDKPE